MIETVNLIEVKQSSRSANESEKELNTKSMKKIINQAQNIIVVSNIIDACFSQKFVFLRQSIYDTFVEEISIYKTITVENNVRQTNFMHLKQQSFCLRKVYEKAENCKADEITAKIKSMLLKKRIKNLINIRKLVVLIMMF